MLGGLGDPSVAVRTMPGRRRVPFRVSDIRKPWEKRFSVRLLLSHRKRRVDEVLGHDGSGFNRRKDKESGR